MPLLRTLLLKSEPAGTLGSLDELFALAHAMEEEASTRYAELAAEMHRQDKPELAAVFEHLSRAEREHVDAVTRWSQSRLGHKPDPALVRWQAPETFDSATAAEIATSQLMTPYRALSMATVNEERAFAFWSYIAAFSEDAAVKAAAETMAREELGHVAAVRKERRKAYHRQRDHLRRTASAEDLFQSPDAAGLERRLSRLLKEEADRLEGPAASRARELSLQCEEMAQQAGHVGAFAADLGHGGAQAIAEALADAYLEAAELSRDQERLEVLQTLAAQAIARLAWIRSLR